MVQRPGLLGVGLPLCSFVAFWLWADFGRSWWADIGLSGFVLLCPWSYQHVSVEALPFCLSSPAFRRWRCVWRGWHHNTVRLTSDARAPLVSFRLLHSIERLSRMWHMRRRALGRRDEDDAISVFATVYMNRSLWITLELGTIPLLKLFVTGKCVD